jgi:hypothetical protein
MITIKMLYLPAVLITVFALIILFFWYGTISGRTLVNRSLAAKLWLSLLVSSVIPLVTVFFVLDLFLNEDYSVRIAQARADAQRFTDLFELRESFADPLVWKFVKDCSWSGDIRTAAADLDNCQTPEKMKYLAAVINSWYYLHDKFDPMLFNFMPRDIAIAGKGGWEYAASGKNHTESTHFGSMLKQIARSIVARRRQGGQQREIDSAAIEGEIVVETGLHTVRSLFGDDVFVKLSHGIGLPVLMHVFSGTAGLIIHAVPNIETPDFVMVWLILFEYESYLSRIAANYKGYTRFSGRGPSLRQCFEKPL